MQSATEHLAGSGRIGADGSSALSPAYLGVFAAAAATLAVLSPPAAVTAILAGFLSVMAAGLALIASCEQSGSPAEKVFVAAVRVAVPLLSAAELWLAVSVLRGLPVVPTVSVALAIPLFGILAVAEGLAAEILQRVFARLGHVAPGAAISMLLAEKFGELACYLRR